MQGGGEKTNKAAIKTNRLPAPIAYWYIILNNLRQRATTYYLFYFYFNGESINSFQLNLPTQLHKLVLLNAYLLCCTLTRKRNQLVR